MGTWYMKGGSNYDDASYYMWFYMDHDGFAEENYDSQNIENDGESNDPFMSFGVDTQTWGYGQQQVEIGLLGSYRIKVSSAGIYGWNGSAWSNLLTGGDVTLDNAFDNGKEIDGANNLANALLVGDGTDKLAIYSLDNRPRIQIIDGSQLWFETEATEDDIILALREDVDNRILFWWDKVDNKGKIFSTHPIFLMASGDINDYLYFESASNIAYLLPVEDKVHYLGTASLSYDHVYSDDFDNTSPYKEFDDPLTDLMKIKGNNNKDKLDYTSLPDFVRSHSRDPSKHIWGKKIIKDLFYDEETKEDKIIEKEVDYIVERAPKDVIENEGWSVNRMVIFLYQCIQELKNEIDDLKNKL